MALPSGEFEAATAVPNPATSLPRFVFRLDEASLVRERVFDASGRLVASAPPRRLGPGMVAMPPSSFGEFSLHSGVYFYRIETADRTLAGRFTLTH